MYKVIEEDKNGKPIFYVAQWDQEHGHWTYPAKGVGTWFGPASYVGPAYRDRKKAARHARYMNTGR